MEPKILIITSTSRKNRFGRKVADWYLEQAKAVAPEVEFGLLDIADLDLALFNEPIDPLSAEMSDKLTDQQKQLAKPIEKADGFVIITSEYNHTIPGPLKNFLDYLPPGAWPRKAVAYVGYGAGGGGMWAILHLIHTMTYLRVISVIDTINIRNIWEALDEQSAPKPDHMKGDVKTQLDELIWWVKALKTARKN